MGSKKKVVLNLIISTASQVITLALGLILPRVILVHWGSEYNGLINSVITIMRYLAILEAGVSTSTLQALYKTIGEKDTNGTSTVVKTAQSYYHKVTFIYTIIVLVVSFIYPLFLKTSISYWEIFFVILLQGCIGIINFAFRAAYQQLLNAEGKYYVISLITLCTTIITYASKIAAIIIFDSVIIMQGFGVLIMAFQALVYAVYFRKKYAWLDKKAKTDFSLLENRKFYIIQQVSGLIFNSTDTIILSIFCGLKVASVYTVYNMVYSALVTFISIVRSSSNFVLGQSYHVNRNKFEKIYTLYSSFQTVLGGFLSSCSIVLIIGFVELYTRGVTDINYINYLAAILFSINIMLDCSRGASLAGANVAGKASQTTWRYILEAAINLTISLALVNWIGINGVLIGTMVAGAWRSIDSIVYFNKQVLEKKPYKELLFVAVNLIVFSSFAFFGNNIKLSIDSYSTFIIYGCITAIVMGVVYCSIYFLGNRITPRKMIAILKDIK